MWDTLPFIFGPPAVVIVLCSIPYLRDYLRDRKKARQAHWHQVQLDLEEHKKESKLYRESNAKAVERRKQIHRVK